LDTRRLLSYLLSLLGILAASVCHPGVAVGAQTAPPGGAPPAGSGTVHIDGYVRAVTGDTLDARLPPGRTLIAIIGIRAPRGNTSCGREATEFLQTLVADGARFDEEPGLVFDGRSRRLYHVTTPDQRSAAAELVAAGLARADGQGSTRDSLAALESAAREARRGCLWQSGTTQ
jgi:endonuclease YncB( thermonuclease family)